MSIIIEKEMEKEYKDWLYAKILLKTVVVDKVGNVLVSIRVEKSWDKRSGKYDINGGALDKKDAVVGSKPHEVALKREVFEEIGLNVESIENVGFYDSGVKVSSSEGNIPVCVSGFVCRVSGVKPEVKLSDEHVESKWVSKDEALSLDFGDDGGMCKGIIDLTFK